MYTQMDRDTREKIAVDDNNKIIKLQCFLLDSIAVADAVLCNTLIFYCLLCVFFTFFAIWIFFVFVFVAIVAGAAAFFPFCEWASPSECGCYLCSTCGRLILLLFFLSLTWNRRIFHFTINSFWMQNININSPVRFGMPPNAWAHRNSIKKMHILFWQCQMVKNDLLGCV